MTNRPPSGGGSRHPERPSGPPSRASSLPPSRASLFPPPPIDFELASAARRIVEGVLGVVPGDTLIAATDEAHSALGVAMTDAASAIGARSMSFELEALASRPFRAVPSVLESALKSAQASVLVMSDDEDEGHFRREFLSLIRENKLRHAHMIGVTRRAMIAGLSADPARIVNATRAVRARLRADSVIKLRSPAGSSLEVRIDASCRWIEHVGVVRPGRWENVPTGVLITSPADVRGVFVADASVGGHLAAPRGVLGSRSVRFEIEGGICRSVRCPDLGLQREIEGVLRREPAGDRIGTILLGTNVGLSEPLGEVVADQSLPGLHLGFGETFPEDTGATWTARTQLVVTAGAADVDVDGVALLRAGRYLVM